MTLVLSDSIVLGLETISENAGRLAYRTIATAANLSATSELVDAPATNLANPATAFGWEAADTADQTITVTNPTGTEIDYIGIARHNLSQPGLEVRVRFDGVTVSDYSPVSSTQALLFLFVSAVPQTIQVDIRGISNPAKIAVLYVGESLRFERNMYVGHTPVVYGRDRQVVTGVSQSGEYLGEVTLNETLSTSINLENLTPEWYRAELDPYFARVPRPPAFYAWRPGTYPAEVGYVWVEGNPRPVNQRDNGMMQVSWNVRGIK